MLRVAIVAAAPLVQSDLRRIVAEAGRFEVACAVPAIGALRARLTREPALFVDVAIVDRPAPEAPPAGAVDRRDAGCDETGEHGALLACLDAGLRVVVLSDAAPAALLPWLEAGASWLAPDASAMRIAGAIEASAAGLVALPAEDFASLRADLRRDEVRASRQTVERLEPLTPRELQVLQRLAAGRANRAIAQELGISGHTAKSHVSRVLAKLAAATRAQAVAIGLREGLIGAPPRP